MRKHLLVVTILMLVWPLALSGQAQQGEKYALKYGPQMGEKWQEQMTGDILDVALQGQPVGIKGNACCDVAAEVTATDDQKHTATFRLSFAQVRSSLNGQPGTPQPPQPLTMTLDQAGKVTDFQSAAGGTVNFMDTGGIPLQVVAVLTHIIRFSSDPVAVGDEWSFEDKYVLPSMGEVPINTRWQLAAVKGNVATISSKATAVLPNFKTPNPMVEGSQMDVKAGRAYLTELNQEFDMTHSRLVSSAGSLRIEAMVEMQGTQMPIVMTLSFSLKPQAKATEPPR